MRPTDEVPVDPLDDDGDEERPVPDDERPATPHTAGGVVPDEERAVPPADDDDL